MILESHGLSPDVGFSLSSLMSMLKLLNCFNNPKEEIRATTKRIVSLLAKVNNNEFNVER